MRAERAAKRFGASYINDGGEITVEAPPFHIWNEGDVHMLVCHSEQDAIQRMSFGLRRCEDVASCDWCLEHRKLRIVR